MKSRIKSGRANEGDEALNIWDLESNALEWTQEAEEQYVKRIVRGGHYYTSNPALYRYRLFAL